MVHGLATYLGFGIWLWEFRGAGSRGLRRCIITFRARHQAVLTQPCKKNNTRALIIRTGFRGP